MCGIVGYLGKDKALPVLLGGLKNLEYRGYDSAGVLVYDGKKAQLVKAVGKVANLAAKIPAGIKGNVGIAHTRWATHGAVSERNAHPHADCTGKIFIVHNGIIENFKELKDKLSRSSHHFNSETDSEVLAHLIESLRDKDKNIALEEAVRLALKFVRGTYGLVVFDAHEPGKLVAARNFSPLLIGSANRAFIIASDASAVLEYTNRVLYLDDGEIATVTMHPFGYRIMTIGRDTIKRSAKTLEGQDVVLAKKGGYPHFMLKEIMEAPDAIRNSIRGRIVNTTGEVRIGGLKEVERELARAERIIITACGSAYLAGKVGEYIIEELAGIPVEVEYASEFRYRKPTFRKNDVFLAVSQSGETADTLASLYEAKNHNVLTLGIVNVVGSTLSRETDAGVYQHIGPEIGVAATKSFISQVSILTLLALYLGQQRGLPGKESKKIVSEILKIPEAIEAILKQKNTIKKLVGKYARYKNFFFLGRKYNSPVALEGALKLKEIAYVHAEGYAAGEMKHGPIALIDKNFPTIAIMPQDSVYEKMTSNISEIKARGGKVIAIATEGDTEIKKAMDDVLYIPKTTEMLSPILSVMPAQLFAYYFGVQKGYNVDKPRNLAKSVTVE